MFGWIGESDPDAGIARGWQGVELRISTFSFMSKESSPCLVPCRMILSWIIRCAMLLMYIPTAYDCASHLKQLKRLRLAGRTRSSFSMKDEVLKLDGFDLRSSEIYVVLQRPKMCLYVWQSNYLTLQNRYIIPGGSSWRFGWPFHQNLFDHEWYQFAKDWYWQVSILLSFPIWLRDPIPIQALANCRSKVVWYWALPRGRSTYAFLSTAQLSKFSFKMVKFAWVAESIQFHRLKRFMDRWKLQI